MTQWDDNAIFTAKFAGWTLEPGTEPAKALVPGTYTDTGEEHLNLYSVWKPVGTYQMGVRAERQGGTAIYTLFDKETGNGKQHGRLCLFVSMAVFSTGRGYPG